MPIKRFAFENSSETLSSAQSLWCGGGGKWCWVLMELIWQLRVKTENGFVAKDYADNVISTMMLLPPAGFLGVLNESTCETFFKVFWHSSYVTFRETTLPAKVSLSSDTELPLIYFDLFHRVFQLLRQNCWNGGGWEKFVGQEKSLFNVLFSLNSKFAKTTSFNRTNEV